MLKLDLSPTTGAFTITVNGAFSLTSSEYRVGNRSSTSGKLKLSGSAAVNGTDSLGPWRGTRLFWTAPQHQNNAGYLMATTFQQYPGDPAILVFEQSFEQTLSFDDGNPLPPVIEPCFDSLKYADDDLPPLTSEGVATLLVVRSGAAFDRRQRPSHRRSRRLGGVVTFVGQHDFGLLARGVAPVIERTQRLEALPNARSQSARVTNQRGRRTTRERRAGLIAGQRDPHLISLRLWSHAAGAGTARRGRLSRGEAAGRSPPPAEGLCAPAESD